MQPGLQQVFDELYEWCHARDFAGYDPFDALNSRLFQSTPLKNSRTFRLAWTQFLKRAPVNLRPLVSVPVERNAKGVALFALAALANHRRLGSPLSETIARKLLDYLLEMKLTSGHGTAWGYNFDWQSRVFFAPRGTPTIVPTAFAARALIEAAEIFKDDRYLETARSTCEFILNDLIRSLDSDAELCFSYSTHAKTRIYNASLLAGETLAAVGAATKEAELCNMAIRATRYVTNRQRGDGAWTYGEESNQAWVDNFHTAFVLTSLARIMRDTKSDEFQHSLAHGFDFWRGRFFLADGSPKYYDDSPYPIDIHSAATAIATLVELHELDPQALPLAEKIARWTVDNLRDPNGFFYYQRRRFFTVRTPFMRWNQAWMLYGVARLLEQTSA
jgi:hypothetical protein